MKKLLAMFLALTLVFSMPGAVFAENETESTVSEQTDDAMETTELEQSTAAVDSTVLNLAGDAVEEVVNLKNGQSVTTDNDVAVRLNVQEDPEETEYTVTMDGESVEEDHSTSQYHFYYLPSEQMNGAETNVSVSTQAAEEISTQALTQGTGTAENPYRIDTADDLKAFRDKVNGGNTSACALLTSNITLDKNESWTPIGTRSNKYAGTFDGDNHTISGINVNNSDYAGLFGVGNVSDGASPVIKNLTISKSSIISTGNDAGTFAGWSGGTFINCHTTSDVNVQGTGEVGGIVGYYQIKMSATSTMEQCSNLATVTEKNTNSKNGIAGGLVGNISNGLLTINNSFNAGSISSETTGKVQYIGGLVGRTSTRPFTANNVYNVGSVTVSNAGTNVGGLIGNAQGEVTITNAYEHGTVANTNGTGGAIVGIAGGAVTLKNVYKTGSLADKLDGVGTVTGPASVKTKDELKSLAPMLGGEFANDLAGDAAVNNGFPVLKWQNPDAASADILQVKVKDQSGTVVLDNEGSTDPTHPTEMVVSFDSSALNIYTADRIYLNVGTDNTGDVKLGMKLATNGTLSKELTKKKDGYTADELYFYRLPGVVGRTVYAVHTQDGTARYYKLQIQRKAADVVRYGALSAAWRDDNPALNTTYDADTGYLTAQVNVSNSFARYNKGVLEENNKADSLLTYDKPFKYYSYDISAKAEDGTQKIQFARVGRWWAANKSATDSMSSIPIAAWWGNKNVANQYLTSARALKNENGYTALPDDLKKAFDSAIQAVSDGWNDDTAKPLYLDASGNYTTTVTDFVARDACGAPITGEYCLEYQENLLLDYMDIIKTYLKNSDLGSLKYQALKNLTAGVTAKKEKLKVVTAMAVTDDTTKSAYEYYYQRAWRIVNASDISEINKMLSNLGLETVEPEMISEKVQVFVGDTAYDVELTGGGTSISDRKTVTVTVPHVDAGMKRIYVTCTENDTLEGSMDTISGKGYTRNDLFFYDTPAEQQSNTVNLTHVENGTSYYYAIKIVSEAKSGKALGPKASMGKSVYSEATPGGLNFYDSGSGYIYGGVKFGPMIYAGMNLYTNGTADREDLEPDWAALETNTKKLYYLANTNQAYFGRPGFYWIPVTNGTTSGLLPMRISYPGDAVTTVLNKAEAVKNTAVVSTEAKEMLTAAIQKVENGKANVSKPLYLKKDGSNPDSIAKYTEIQARTYFGAMLYGESLIEKELNTVLDLTDIFTTWGKDAELAAQQFEAYQKIMNMDGGVHAAIEIQSVADRDLYQKIRQAKWNIVKATDLAGINEALTSLGLDTIGGDEPEVKLGDINCDGKIELSDAVLLIKYCNGQTTLTKDQLANANLNCDSKIELADAVMLVKYCNGVISEFPANSK